MKKPGGDRGLLPVFVCGKCGCGYVAFGCGIAAACYLAAGIIGQNVWPISLSVANLLLAIRCFRRYRAVTEETDSR